MSAQNRLAVVACALGACASLAPWAAYTVGLSVHATHSDLWIALAGFVAGLAVQSLSSQRLRATAWMVIGFCEIVVVVANWPRLWQAHLSAGEPGVQGFLGAAANERLVAYAVVGLAGIALVCAAAWPRRAPASPGDPSDNSQ